MLDLGLSLNEEEIIQAQASFALTLFAPTFIAVRGWQILSQESPGERRSNVAAK